MFRIAGYSDTVGLWRHSKTLASSVRNHVVLDVLIALEKCGLLAELGTQQGVTPAALAGFDAVQLKAALEYLTEAEILEQLARGHFRVRKLSEFPRLRSAVYAAMAYNQPIRQLHRLIRGDDRYGVGISRDDQYDAMASEDITSRFYYGFTARTLRGTNCASVLDLGCGTGAFPAYLARHADLTEVIGVDVSDRAIAEGRRRGYESGPVRLLVGDAMALEIAAAKLKTAPEIVSMMFVLHEFDDEDVGRILGSIHRAFPGARILLTEMILRDTEEALARNNTALPELRYVHQLSQQVIRSRDGWVHLFNRSNYRLDRRDEHQLSNTQCLVFSPSISAVRRRAESTPRGGS
ncbi:MAG TPA: class I SAM-dependent methyltransferase [Burkholderiales bacterium]|nr:class I SAM-dependent methyltransferase [Burkholderiales bacterium]